jgi:hypothetical protein
VSAQSGIGWGWFVAWSAVGALATFSFLTGLSIGILFVPLVVVGLVWVARRSPKGAERIGFAAGIGVMLLVVAFIHRDGDGIDPKPWLSRVSSSSWRRSSPTRPATAVGCAADAYGPLMKQKQYSSAPGEGTLRRAFPSGVRWEG